MTWNRDAISSATTGPVVVRGPKLVRATGYSLRELERAGLTAGAPRVSGCRSIALG